MLQGIPGVIKSFSAMAQTAFKTKALIALAIGITVRCDGCVAFHVKAALDQGASRDEMLETTGMAIYMDAGPSMAYGVQALEAYNQFGE